MNAELWKTNTPWAFWQLSPDLPPEVWLEAVRAAAGLLELAVSADGVGELLAQTLGEGRFGPDHWRLGAVSRIYYHLKPLIPRPAITMLKRLNGEVSTGQFILGWPVEDRYVRFLWQSAAHALTLSGQPDAAYRRFWPGGHQFSFVLTHDIESGDGQAFAGKLADLEESLGFRSSFNFVPERYPLDQALIADLRSRGFEIGLHGLKHDGKLYNSRRIFMARAAAINRYLEELEIAGFRSPLTHRHPEWLQALHVEYDLSFFDTDPYEPLPGGTMSIWPFRLGRFIELPYTLVQDCTLIHTLRETTPQVWLDKVSFIERFGGMALLNAHPDYLKAPAAWQVYRDFLAAMQNREGCWHALPRDAARWWKARSETPASQPLPGASCGRLAVENGALSLLPHEEAAGRPI
jgi:peptidoglycan/xylan/chitin deacetylase (PgdA/CDA1 family)